MTNPMKSTQPDDVLLSVSHLKKYFPIRRGVFMRVRGYVKAVDDVSFSVVSGRTLGLVGESGCGKTTIARTVLRLYEPTAGEAIFEGQPLFRLSHSEMRPVRRSMQIVFQDPFDSLNPRMAVGGIVEEPLRIHGIGDRRERRRRVVELFERVGLTPEHMSRYPHEFSGGQRQRIGIARALALNPKLIVCDEPVSALDVSIQAQVLNLLMDLQKEFGLSYLFIAHDLSVVRNISDTVAVMYRGKIVEIAESEDLFEKPLHPYTKALLAAVPVPDPRQRRERTRLRGDVGSSIDQPDYCRFYDRDCPHGDPSVCAKSEPELIEVGPGHKVACFKIGAETTG